MLPRATGVLPFCSNLNLDDVPLRPGIESWIYPYTRPYDLEYLLIYNELMPYLYSAHIFAYTAPTNRSRSNAYRVPQRPRARGAGAGSRSPGSE
jgi:hypothetical protein